MDDPRDAVLEASSAEVEQQLGYGLIAGLKDNQPDLIAEARRGLEPMARDQAPEATTPWKRHLLRHHPRCGGSSPWPWRSALRLIKPILPGLCLGDTPSVRDASWPSMPSAAPT